MVRIAAVLREAFMNHFSCFIKHGHLTTMFFFQPGSDLESGLRSHVQSCSTLKIMDDHLSCHWKLKNQTIALPVQRIYLKPASKKQSANLKGSFSRSPASVWSLWLFSHTNGQRYSSFLLCLVSQAFADLPASFSKMR